MTTYEVRPFVRRVDNLTIIFKDKHTIVITDGSYALAFQRWFDRHRFDYTNSWKPFDQALRRRSYLSLAAVALLLSSISLSKASLALIWP